MALIQIVPIFYFLITHYLILAEAQIPILDQQPFFRGFISALPFSRVRKGELQPSPSDVKNRPIVKIRDGILQGSTLRTVRGRAVSAFQSIPFAQPPVGNLRFRDPIKNTPWKGTLNALGQSPRCIQIDLLRGLQVHGQEDCLYLNVYVPQESENGNVSLPVMVFIHGGSFIFGTGSTHGPRYLLDHEPVVLVTINYRLGPFGFLSTGDMTSPGNQGLKDQVMALKWVKENVEAFGGNPDSITIFGQSVGGTSVGLHIVSPLSRDLFHRAIQQSTYTANFAQNWGRASETARKVGERFNCPVNCSERMVECLRKVPGKILAPVQLSFVKWFLFPMNVFTPTFEPEHSGAFMTKSLREYYENGEAANVTLISGITQHESTWVVAGIMLSSIHVSDINTDWDRVGSILLEMNQTSLEWQNDSLRKMWEFYLGNGKLSWATRMRFGEMISDRFVTDGALEALRFHSMYTSSKVYAYQFTYQGRFSIVQQMGRKTKDWGVSHLDDMIYLMNNPSYHPTLNAGDPELEMSDLMTKTWVSFATYDKPLVGNNIKNRELWKPIQPATSIFSPIQFLDLNLFPKMINDPYAKRYSFWKNEIHSGLIPKTRASFYIN